VLEFVARAIMQEKEIKEIPVRKEEVKLFQFADDMILSLKNPKDFTKKLLDMINTFDNLGGHKINTQKISSLNDEAEKKIRRTIPFTTI
jgi:hypothetical protein